MIYTIISRLPFIANDNSGNKILKIFVIGSVLYIILNYYVQIQTNDNNIINTLKQWFYYAMAADFAIAYISSYLFPGQEQETTQKQKYSPEQIKEIQNKMTIANNYYKNLQKENKKDSDEESEKNNSDEKTTKSKKSSNSKKQSTQEDQSENKKDKKNEEKQETYEKHKSSVETDIATYK